jgi:hypothetical protein
VPSSRCRARVPRRLRREEEHDGGHHKDGHPRDRTELAVESVQLVDYHGIISVEARRRQASRPTDIDA